MNPFERIAAMIDAAAPPLPPAAADFVASESSQMGGSPAKPDQRRGAGRRATQRRAAAAADPPAPPPDDGEAQRALDRRLAFFPQTDLGNAERFRERNRGKLIWCAALGWLFWDSRRWSRVGAEEKVRAAEHDTVRSIQDEADAIADTELDRVVIPASSKGDAVFLSDLLRRWGRSSEANSRMVPIGKHAAAYLAVQPGELDADPFKINVRNGTLVARKTTDGSDYISFKPHDPADRITKLAPVDYDPDADCEKFNVFLGEIQPNADTRIFLRQWKGLGLTGDVGEQKLCVFWGKGQNGKSVLEDVTANIAGDYSETVPIETFLAEGRGRNAGQATPDLAILPGVRMLRTSEPKKGASLDEALIKLATGGEPIIARHLNRDYFKFYPSFKLTISGNYRPKITGADEGIWRRVTLVPFTVWIEKPNKRLAAELLASEASGILNWMLDGLRDWLDRGLVAPEEVRTATAEYRRDSDQLGRFLEACVLVAPGERVQSSLLHAVFNAWSKANSMTEWKGRGFSDAMTERGFKKDKSSVIFFLDIRLLKSVGDFVDDQGHVHGGGARAVPNDAPDDRDLAF